MKEKVTKKNQYQNISCPIKGNCCEDEWGTASRKEVNTTKYLKNLKNNLFRTGRKR